MFEMNGVKKGASLLTLNHLRSSSRAKVALFGVPCLLGAPECEGPRGRRKQERLCHIKYNWPPNGKIVPRPSAEK